MKNIPIYTILFSCLAFFVSCLCYFSWFHDRTHGGLNHYFVGNGITMTLDKDSRILTCETKESYSVDPNVTVAQIHLFLRNKEKQLASPNDSLPETHFFSTGSITKIPRTQTVSISGEERQIGMEYGHSKALIDVNTVTGNTTVGGIPVKLDENKEIVSWEDVEVIWTNQGH